MARTPMFGLILSVMMLTFTIPTALADLDGDGVDDGIDSNPHDKRVGYQKGGSRDFVLAESYFCEGSSIPEAVARFNLMNYSDILAPESCEYENTTIPSPNMAWHHRTLLFSDETTLSLPVGPTYEHVLPNICTKLDLSNDTFDYLWIEAGQIDSAKDPLIHCITEGFDDPDSKCITEVFTLVNESYRSEPLLQFECYSSRSGAGGIHMGIMGSHLGAFGDLNSDGIIDFVKGNYPDDSCEIYLGDINTQFESAGVFTGCTGPLTVADIDFDGDQDIVSNTKILFLENLAVVEEFSFSPPPSFSQYTLGSSIPFDVDMDGDLDIVMKRANGILENEGVVQTDIYKNNWEPDDDNDGVSNANDLCLETKPGVTVNSVGCDIFSYDSDNDGVVDGYDLCRDTSNGSEVDSNGCSGIQVDADDDGVLNSQDLCPGTNVNGNSVDDTGCVVDRENSNFGMVFFAILVVILMGILIINVFGKLGEVGISGGDVLSLAGKIVSGTAGLFTGMHQLQKGNISGAVGSFSNAAKGKTPQNSTNADQGQPIANVGKSTFSCQNPACNYQFANVSDAKMMGNTPERCPSCSTPVMRNMPWNSENPVQNSISELGKVTYACMQPSCAYEVGPVPKGTSVGRCMNCGGPMKKKSIH